MLAHGITNPTELTVLVSLPDSGSDADSVAGGSDFTFCFNKPQQNTEE